MITKNWTELNEGDKQLVVAVHCTGYQTKNADAMLQAFETGTPDITFGTHAGGKRWCQVAANSVTRMQLLINPILLKL